MESTHSSIKMEMVSQENRKASPKFVGPNVHDTAWLAMIEDHKQQHEKHPSFKCCFHWILNNLKDQEAILEAALDEELLQLCLVDQIQILGLAEHFPKEIEDILSQIYRNLTNQGSRPAQDRDIAKKLYKDALAFRLLRLQGYETQQSSFCWFLQHEDILNNMEREYENIKSVLYNVYRATDIMFPGESLVEKARQFSKKLLQNSVELNCCSFDDLVMFSNPPQNMIKHELDVPWISRLDHLDHRIWIEETRGSALWTRNISFHGFPWVHDDKLMQLAYQNYELRQSAFREELNELNRWSKEKGLNNIGFGREKTLYSYFATAASFYLPSDSVIRLICAKCSIAITVADDYYDEHGSMRDLQILTEAIQKWNGTDLTGHGKTIFDAVDDIVRFISSNIGGSSEDGNRVEVQAPLQDIWRETFNAWMTERIWSESGHVPSMDEYLEVGHISIGAHVIVLSASCLLPNRSLKPPHYQEITNLLMTSSRLLNDMQSYQKEQQQGKINYVLIYMKENPGVSVNGAIEEVKRIVDEKRKALLELALKDDDNDNNKKFKQLHLACLKVFNMFFNSTNLFDTKTALLNEINKAIYVPLDRYHEEDEATLLSPKFPSKQIFGTLPLAELSLKKKKDALGMSACLGRKNGIWKYKLKMGLKKATLFYVRDGSYYNFARPTTITSLKCFL